MVPAPGQKEDFLGQKYLAYIYKLVEREVVKSMRLKIEEGVSNR